MLTVRLVSIHYAAPDVNVYMFRAPDGTALPPAPGGSHIDLHVDATTTRQYSLVNEGEAPDTYQIAVRRMPDGRGGSDRWHRESIVGETYTISAPRCIFPVSPPPGMREILLAGGIGITPMLSIWRARRRAGLKPHLYYWGPERGRMAFYDELAGQDDVTLFETTHGMDQPRISDIIRAHPGSHLFYACGPERMIHEAEQALGNSQQLLIERFAPLGAVPSVQDNGYTVRLARSGHDLHVLPGETILAACLRNNLDVAYSCEQGVCGACEIRVLKGRVNHRDALHQPGTERDVMMICCSEPADASILELDL